MSRIVLIRYLKLGAVFALAAVVGAVGWWILRRPLDDPQAQVVEAAATQPADLPAPSASHVATNAACHDEKLTAPEVPVTRVGGSPVIVRGGQLQDGIYDVSKYQVFGRPREGALQSRFRQTIVIEQGGTVAKLVRVGMRGEVETTTWSSQVVGSTIRLTGLCPRWAEGTGETVEFGVLGEELITSFEQAGVPVQVTYRRRSG